VLEELRIRGLGVIDDAVLHLGPGLTVVTGETGAGKTMVVTGLLLLFGGRADSARVRSGVEQASIDGRLELPSESPALARARHAGAAIDDGTALVLRRVVTVAGRSRAYVGGTPAPVSVLGELAEHVLAVHGQSDQIRLTRPSQQRAALDRFAGVDLDAFGVAYQRWRALSATLAERTARMAELRREADLLGFGVGEIESVGPQPSEDVELATLASRLSHADALRLAAQAAHDLLLGDADDPTSDAADVSALLGAVRRALIQVEGDDPQLDALAGRVAEVVALVTDVGAELASYRDGVDADPARLAQVQARRSVLNGLIRKYADVPEEGLAAVASWAADARQRLASIDVSDEAMAALSLGRDAAAAETAALAEGLSKARSEAAEALARAVTQELAGLALANSSVTIAVAPRPATAGSQTLVIDGVRAAVGPDGADEVEFLFRSHPDAPALPIGRGASGGELSRIMLGLELCLAGSDPVPTMVFDEVDAGVGGRAAVEVGRRLARLARDRQVIVVTHLAQVAAYADQHVVVDRSVEGSVVGSDLRLVTGADRLTELARMLAGTDSGTARDHARELLAAAATERAQGDPPSGNSANAVAGAAGTASAKAAVVTRPRSSKTPR
jgi:DNA repair protein RecN (Recombination protein N)